MNFIQKARKILFEIDLLTPSDICDILSELEHLSFRDEFAFREYLKEKIESIIEEERTIEIELKRMI